MSGLPSPLVPPGVDMRGVPIPREAFAQMAVLQFGVSIEDARAHVNAVADRLERRSRNLRRTRR